MKEIGEIKSNIYKIAAVTDRGQRLNKLISPMYEEKANEMDKLIDALKDFSFEMSEELLSGEWDCLLYTSPSPRDLSTSRMPSSA